MGKKTFSASLTLFISFFFLINCLNATPPRITEELDSETNRMRLFVRGEITVPQKDEISAPLSLTFRTCALEDFQKPDGSWGIVSQLRADPDQMKHFIGGVRDPAVTLKTGYQGIWRKRLVEKDENGCYTPATLFTLFTQDSETPGVYKGIGYFAIGRQTPTQLIFFGGLIPEFQHKGIITSVGAYLLNELLPAFRTNPLTAAKSKAEHEELLITMDSHNPIFSQIATEVVPSFSKKLEIPIQYKMESTKDRHHGEHQFKIDLKALYEGREAAASASVAPSELEAKTAAVTLDS